MPNAPLPADEAARLQSLRAYQILDTPPEAAFERITVLTAQLFHVPIALVSLVDSDRQWFKACFGTDMRETSRELSFCAYAILSDQVLVVPDAASDARFLDNILVTGPPHIRFYAGAPLRGMDGLNLGSLCVIDTVPRSFTSEEQATLADLAAIVVDELELRHTARELREREATLRKTLQENSQLATAVASVSSGVLVTDPNLPDNPIIVANPGFCELSGYSVAEVLGRNCRFLQGPDTEHATVLRIRQAIAEGAPF